MTEQTLKIAAIGLTDSALELLDIAYDSGAYEIAAVADTRQERLEVCEHKYQCAVFTDYRQLIVTIDTDFLLFGEPTHQCIDFIRLALQQKFHVLKMLPPALNFSQLTELYRLAKKQQRLFVTMQKGRFRLPFEHIRNYLTQAKDDQSWHLVSAVCHVPMQVPEADMRWLNDPNMAGGGVLLHNCYDLIDELLLCFGLPQKVYALTINQAPDRQQRMSLTEDTAIVTMQFTDALIAQICASRTLGPARRHLRIHGKEQHLTATEEEVVLYTNDGSLQEQKNYTDDVLSSQKRMIDNLTAFFQNPETCKLYPVHGFDLNTMAVIEAAYLSTRTGMAEDPTRILKLADIDPSGAL